MFAKSKCFLTWASIITLSLIVCESGLAGSKSIDDGVAWLEARQKEDGSWGDKNKNLVDTIEVYRTLLKLNKGVDALNKALPFIYQIEETDNDKSARKASALVYSTADTSSLIDKLIAVQNEDGGWGLGEKKQSCVEDTFLVVEALIEAEITDTQPLTKALDFIVSKQKDDGSWIYSEENAPSDLIRTARGLTVLKKIENFGLGSAGLTEAVDKSQQYIESKASGDTFGDTLETAYAYLALIMVKQPSQVGNTLTWLSDAQRSDGSWESDIFTTAVALKAIGAVLPPEAPAMADLSIDENGVVFNPGAPFTGDQVEITATIFNIGEVDTQSVTVEFFNRDPRIDGTPIGSVQTIASVPAGGSAQVTETFDTSNLVGVQQIVVFVDRDNAIQESKEINNTVAKQISIGGVPDLFITADDISFSNATPQAFELIEITTTVKNIGNTPAENVVVRFLDNDVKIVDMVLGGVNPGESNTATLSTNFTEGEHAIKIQIDPDNLLTDEVVKDNNEAEKSINVAAIPVSPVDLKVQSVEITPSAPLENDPVAIQTTVINQGGEAVTSQFQIEIKNGTTTLHTFDVASLASGQKAILTLDTSFAAGNHTITATADSGNAITEGDETNNTATANLSVQSTATDPDLFFTEFQVNPGSTVLGDAVQVSATVKNSGTTAADNVKVRFFEGQTQIGGDFTIVSLAGGQSGTVQFQTSFSSAGTKNLKALVDPDGLVAESDETNNELNATVDVQAVPRPDLIITAEDISFSNDSPSPGETVQITINVKNQGTEPSGAFKVLFTKGNPFIGGAIFIGEVDAPNIPAGSEVSVFADYSFQHGSHDVFVFVESEQIVVESNEGNNLANKNITTLDIPDLAVSSDSITLSHTDLDQGFMVGINAVIDNLGSVDVSNVPVMFAERNGENLILIGTTTIDSLAAGTSFEVELVWHASPGNKTIEIIVDGNNEIIESSETNNAASKDFMLTLSQMGMKLYKVTHDTEEETDVFAPYDTLKIAPEVYIENIAIGLTITMPDGNAIAPFSEEGDYYFSIGSNPPGVYEATMVLTDQTTGALIQTINKSFTVDPLFRVGDIDIKTNPSYLRAESTEPVTITLVVQNKSNIDGSADATVTVIAPDGSEVGSFTPALDFEIGRQVIVSLDPTEVFSNAGIYTITAVVTPVDNGQDPVSHSESFEVHPATRITAEKELAPLSLEPIGEGKVRVKIDMAGVGSPEDVTPIDLMLIIDTSGSMGYGSGGIEAARNAAVKFVDMLPDNAKAGLVTFSSGSSLRFSLSYDRDGLKSTINSLGAGGGTNIGSGINRARTHFNDVSTPERRRIAVLLSDGSTSNRSYALSEADNSANDNIVIFTIGLGSYMDEPLMEDIAFATGGTYYSSPTNDELEAVFVRVFEEAISLAAVDIVVKDTVNAQDIDIVNDSITPAPDEINLNEDAIELIWNIEKATIDDQFVFEFDVELSNLQAGEERLVNKSLDISFLAPDGETQLNFNIGEQYVSVGELGKLIVNVDKEQYVANENADVEVEINLDGNKSKTFDEKVDWENGNLDGCSAEIKDGSLFLESAGESPETNILINGGFETVDGTGWKGITTDFWGMGSACYISSYQSISGSYSLYFYLEWGSARVYQTVEIPAEAISATLSFKDRCRYTYGTMEYLVEIQNLSGETLKTVYQKNSSGAWGVTSRSFDVSEFIGQTVKLKFSCANNYEFASTILDDVELNIKTRNYAPTGTANYILDAGHVVSWSKIIYDASTPDGTSINFRARSANGVSQLASEEFCQTLTGDRTPIPVEPSRFLELEISMATDNIGVTPDLTTLRVSYVDYSTEDGLELKTFIVDENGVLVKELSKVSPNIELGSKQNFHFNFNTADNKPGQYSAVGELYVGETKIATGKDNFEIIGQDAQEIVDGSVTTDKLKYSANEEVGVISKVFNQSLNLNLNNVNVKIEIKDGSETILETFNYVIPSLLINDERVKNWSFSTGLNPPGDYLALQTVSIGEEELFTRQAAFEIISDFAAGKGVSGSLAVNPQVVERNVGSVTFAINAENTGNIDLEDVSLIVRVYDPDSFETLQNYVYPVSLPMSGAAYSNTMNYENVTLWPKSYPVAYFAEVTIDEETITIPLDVNGFVVVNTPPVAIAGLDQNIEGTSPDGNQVTLNGSTSTDVNSINPPAMDDDIVSYQWKEGETILGTGETIQHVFKWGTHAITLTVTDSVGATGTDEVLINIVDTIPPTASNFIPAHEEITANKFPEISAELSDTCSGVNSSTITMTVGGATAAVDYDAESGVASTTPEYALSDGWHDVVLGFKDNAGNEAIAPEWRIGVDTTPPTFAAQTPAPDSIVSSNQPEISVVLADAFSGVDPNSITMTLDGVGVTTNYDSGTGELSFTPSSPLADGWRNIEVTVRDAVGNEASATWKFGVDSTAPVLTDLLPDQDIIAADNQPEISVTATDTFSGVNADSIVMTLDGNQVAAVYDPATGKISFTPAAALADGWRNVTVTVQDNVGNESSTTWKFGVDVAAPTISDLNPAPGSIVNENQPEITAVLTDNFSGIDPATITLTIGGTDVPFTYDPNTGAVTGTPSQQLQDGDYTIVLTVKDMVGNLATSTGWTIKIQTWVIFHNSSSGRLDITGSDKNVLGRIHSNADIRIQGSNNDVSEKASAVGSININGSKHDLPDQAPGSNPEPIPVYDFNFYMNAATHTHQGTWHVKGNDVIPSGIHYVDGDVKITANNISANCVIVATGDIRITGKAPNLTSSDTENHMLLFSRDGDIHISGNTAVLKGIIYAPSGDAQLTSSGETIEGAVIADTVDISGSGITFLRWGENE